MGLSHHVSQTFLNMTPDYMYQVPFLKSLHNHLSDNLVFEEVYVQLFRSGVDELAVILITETLCRWYK